MEILIVVKDVFTTKITQAMGMFEPFKFAGLVHFFDADTKNIQRTPLEMLGILLLEQPPTDRIEIVGIMIPSLGSAFVEGHKAMNDKMTKRWGMVEDMCKANNAMPLEWINERSQSRNEGST